MISRFICQKHEHKNQEIKHICIKKDCNSESNLGCRQCMLELHNNHNFDEILEYDEELFKEKTNIEELFQVIKNFTKNINQELQDIVNLLISCDYYSIFIQDRSLSNFELLGKRLKKGFISKEDLQNQLSPSLAQIKQLKQMIKQYKSFPNSKEEMYSSAYEIYKSDLDGALYQLDQALDQDDQYIPALQLKADLFNIKGQFEEALACCEGILKMNENNIITRITKAEALVNLKKFPEALQQTQFILDKQENNKFALLIQAKCQNQQESKITLNKLKDIDPCFYKQNIKDK